MTLAKEGGRDLEWARGRPRGLEPYATKATIAV
jgi:hypothetical protein